MRRYVYGLGALLLLLLVTALPSSGRPAAQAADSCTLALTEADQLEAFLDHNAPANSAQRSRETEFRAFITQVRAGCATTTTTAPTTTTTTAPTTTTTTEPTTTTTAPTTTTTTPPSGGWPDESTTGPVAGHEACATTVHGEYEITQPGVYDGLCVVDGSLVILASNVRVTNAQLTAAPPGDFVAAYIPGGRTGIEIDHSIIDCGPASTGTPVASQGVWGEDGTSLNVHHNEIRDCTDGIELSSNAYFGYNLIWRPDNTDDAHADGVQFAGGIHDTVFEHNSIIFPDASSAFQFHYSTSESGGTNLIVRNNWLQGGAAVLRLPHSGSGNQVYGNLINRLTANEFFVCTNGTQGIAVWGAETGNPADVNINHETGGVLERADC